MNNFKNKCEVQSQDKAMYHQALEYCEEDLNWPPYQMMSAICYTKLCDYPTALLTFRSAFLGMLQKRSSWFGLSLPNRLVETFAMAFTTLKTDKLQREIAAYRKDYRGDSLFAHIAYAEMNFLLGNDDEVSQHSSILLKNPKAKYPYAKGLVIQAILNRNQDGFSAALDQLLLLHHGKATRGNLRSTPERFLCLSAMTLTRIAVERRISVYNENDYLSTAYLAYGASQM